MVSGWLDDVLRRLGVDYDVMVHESGVGAMVEARWGGKRWCGRICHCLVLVGFGARRIRALISFVRCMRWLP